MSATPPALRMTPAFLEESGRNGSLSTGSSCFLRRAIEEYSLPPATLLILHAHASEVRSPTYQRIASLRKRLVMIVMPASHVLAGVVQDQGYNIGRDPDPAHPCRRRST